VNGIKTIPLRKFKDVRGLNIGARVDIGGRPATVKSIGAGRVVVDFNPPLSGKTLIYKIRILEEITDDKKKIEELVLKRMPLSKPEQLSINLSDDKLIIRFPDEVFLMEGIQYIKRALFNDITKYLANISEVIFEEVLSKTQTSSEEEQDKKTIEPKETATTKDQPKK